MSRTRFKIVRSHISMLNPIINIGYKAYSYPKRAYDVAMSYNLNETLNTFTWYRNLVITRCAF
ncbi:DUF6266 family protein [Sphingobacterium anhuiense]|uniref:DUF6266 family protein n=1 Tax=Sphingobacterium TaxID=28453 RepID=UPI003C307795